MAPLPRSSASAQKKKGPLWALLVLVPMAGLEPAQLTLLPPQDSVSTNSTTSARFFYALLR